MKNKAQNALFVLFFFSTLSGFSQPVKIATQLRLDSLRSVLAIVKSDTAKIRLRYVIGTEGPIYRNGFWDSLANDAYTYEMPLIEIRALDRLGFLLRQNGKIAEAINCYNKAIAIAEKNEYKIEMVSPLHHLSKVYFIQNNIKTALYYCYRGLKISEELKDSRRIIASYVILGEIYFRSGEPRKALKLHLLCLNISEQYGFKEEIANILLDIGTDYNEFNDLKNASYYYFRSAKYITDFGQCNLTIAIYNSVGAAYAIRHQLDSATSYFLRSYKICEAINDKTAMASTMVLLAGNSFYKGDYKNAKKQALKAFYLVQAVGFTGQIPGLAFVLKNIYEKEGDYKTALKYYELYANVKDSVTSEKNKKEALEKGYAYDLEKKENANKFLAQQNQIQSLQLSKTNYLIVGLACSLLLILIISFLIIRQNKITSAQHSMQIEQKLLRSQMNPHFIFNSLQAIQKFILEQDEKKAVIYLSSFAGLIRNVLENSRMEYIQLKKEITLIHKYLQLQKIRFGNRFDYDIHIDIAIDEEYITIPPMLCQPFIENAIEHGMRDIESGGMITVSYTQQNDRLRMEIIDNGHGINASNAKGKQHQSLALEITKERIELMNKKNDTTTNFEIGEAFPMQLERKGVRATFTLPLRVSA